MREEHRLVGAELYEPVGCVHCGETGFAGRTGLFEMLTVTDEVRSLLLGGRDAAAIAATGVSEGMRTMRDDGLDKVRLGVTSLAEVLQVTCAG
jgi:type II secretory ATPase GspE/PulE/Tfp pilus assembly ATPase PilB-like protein